MTFHARYIVERDEQFDDGEHCLVMFGTGDVRYYPTRRAALASIHRTEKRLVGEGARMAQIEWRDGLTPPV